MKRSYKIWIVQTVVMIFLALLPIYSCSNDSSDDTFGNDDDIAMEPDPDPEPDPEPTIDIPGKVLGLTSSNWKLNGFDGTGAGADYEDNILAALNTDFNEYVDDNYFFAKDGFTYFKCYRGLGGSQNSSNPRVELRELNNGQNYYWDGDTGPHTMEWAVRVDQLPKSTSGSDGVLCFGQIHGPNVNDNGVEVDDTIRLQFRGSPNQKSGNVDLKISGYITENQGGSVSLSGYKLNTVYDFKLVMENGRITVYVDEQEVFQRVLNTSGDNSYFKVGNYLQSVKDASFDASSFGLVGISKLVVTHN